MDETVDSPLTRPVPEEANEDLANIFLEVDEADPGLQTAERHLTFEERVIDLRQEEIEQLEAKLAQVSRETAALRKELRETKRQLTMAEELSMSQQEDLAEVRASIPRCPSHSRAYDLTESEARLAYASLTREVQGWVRAFLAPSLVKYEEGHAASLRLDPGLSRVFAALIREPAVKSLTLQGSEQHHAVAVIMAFLQSAFFKKGFFCPLDDGGADATLGRIIEFERAVWRSSRDKSQARQWRVTTLHMLTSDETFERRRSVYVKGVGAQLAGILFCLTNRTGPISQTLFDSVVQPAANLARRFCMSTNVYTLKWPMAKNRSRLELYERHSIGRKAVDPQVSEVGLSYLFDITPGLFLDRVGMQPQVICKAQVLVLEKRSRPAPVRTIFHTMWHHGRQQEPFEFEGSPAVTGNARR